MTERRRTGRWIIGIVGSVVLIGAAAWIFQGGRRIASAPSVALDARSPLSLIANRLHQGDAQALAIVYQRAMARPEGPARPIDEAEGDDWVDTLTGLRAGYRTFSPYGRASALAASARILDKFAVDEAPSCWPKALPPVHDLLTAGLSDTALNVRLAALNEVGRLWVWLPGKTPEPAQEAALAVWKEGFHAPVVRGLADPQPVLRAAAVACLAALPIDSAAAPAVAYVADPDADVRHRVLAGFARRRDLLTDEVLLRRLSDADPRIPPVAEQALKARGLTQEQIGLGGLIAHPRAEMRESVIPLLANRTDIDPVAWLVHLSRDEEESVRIKAAEALAGRPAPEARRRLAEMAIGDPSPAVKKVAGKLVAPGEETASLPPLPGSPSLNPKAN